MNRGEAIALLKQIAEDNRFTFSWISLVNRKPGCELKIRCYEDALDFLNQVAKKRGLELKEAEGTFVIYKKH